VALPPRALTRATTLAAALLLLNASLTFANVWPTPAITFGWQLSAELAIAVLLLSGLAARRPSAPSPRLLRWLAALWVILIVGHYADVTAPALYGREVNLFWDVRYVSDVAAMMTRVAAWWLVLLIVAGAVLALAILYIASRWALGRVAGAVANPGPRRGLAAAAAILLVWFAADRLRPEPDDPYEQRASAFADPVIGTYAHQVRLAATALAARAGTITIAPSPTLASDLSRLDGADVMVVFIESYGAVTYDRPSFAKTLAPARQRLADAAHETGREILSAFVTSPTFGGSSWLAHLSLLSGVQVRDPDTYALMMSRRRDTLVSFFGAHGYRTVALMPGLQQAWPEGAFYHFDTLYDEQALDYKGWPFGWWNIPDEYSLARLNALELAPANRRPVFAVFPTINTHAPFSPTPPYQPDWRRVLSDHPFDQADLDRAFAQPPDWLDLSPDYVRSVGYDLTALAGFVRERAGHGLVMIILGDHQPASMVSGKGAPWDVPVHIVAPPGALADRLVDAGFHRGVDPPRAPLGQMNELAPLVLEAFGRAEPSAAASRASY
jgi:hypothetical protein